MLRQLAPLFALLCLCALLAMPALDRAQAAPASGEPATTIFTSSDLVVVDVVASDSQQNPVHRLAATDFTVLEDGKPQTVKVFEEHQAQPSAPLPQMPKLPAGAFTNNPVAPATGALNILLFDKLNTPMNAQSVVRDDVLKFLKQAPPGTRMAIFSLTTQLKMLQGFTSNPELLRALVMGKKGNQGASPVMDDAVHGDAPGADDLMMDMAQDAVSGDPDGTTVLAGLQEFESEQQSFQLQLRQKYTLDALNQLARYMSAFPGRKNLIWFSGSFPITIMPDTDLLNTTAQSGGSGTSSSSANAMPADPFVGVASAEEEFRQTVDLLARSQVAVYPIDARGLMDDPLMSATQSGSTMMRQPNGYVNAYKKWIQNTAEEQGTMLEMAQATGGHAFVNTNGLKEAIDKAIEEGSNYYTIAYTPTNRKWAGDFRKIQVKVDRPGVTLAYRRGYFADDTGAADRSSAAQSAKPDPSRYDALRTAMLHGGPDPTQLIFVANVRPASPDPETALAPGNQAAKKVSGPFRRYTVGFAAFPSEVGWTVTPDGVHHSLLEFMTYVYDSDGKLMNIQASGIDAAVPAEQFAAMQKGALSFSQQISVPVKGEYYLRIGMCDVWANHVGALEFPVAAVEKLPPLAMPSSAPPAQHAPQK